MAEQAGDWREREGFAVLPRTAVLAFEIASLCFKVSFWTDAYCWLSFAVYEHGLC